MLLAQIHRVLTRTIPSRNYKVTDLTCPQVPSVWDCAVAEGKYECLIHWQTFDRHMARFVSLSGLFLVVLYLFYGFIVASVYFLVGLHGASRINSRHIRNIHCTVCM